jgi:hypothetical protein
MDVYSAFGLGIHSDLPLPELVSCPAAARDVVIRLGAVDTPLPEAAPADNHVRITAEDACFFWDNIGAFQVRRGGEIIVQATPGADEQAIRLVLLGVVMAVLLHQRGLLVLHASAVVIDGEAISFIGAKGQGKSTTAAAVYARGHTLLADDIVALDPRHPEGPMVVPGFPLMKLWPESAASALGDDPECLPRLAPGYNKRARRIAERFAYRPVPLKCIYTLDDGSAPAVKSLPVSQAIVPLIAHSYAARFGQRLLIGAAATAHFRDCARLLEWVPMYKIERPRALEQLPTLARLIESHARSISVATPSRVLAL